MYLGGCECKSLRYKFSGTPLTCYACHCTDCQTSSGSAFALSMLVNDKDIEIIEGEGDVAINTVDYNGTIVKRHYCSQCGTPFWFSANIYPNIVALKPGTFDDTSRFRPIAHLWVRSAQPWVILDNSTPQYEKQPKISELMDLWASKSHESD